MWKLSPEIQLFLGCFMFLLHATCGRLTHYWCCFPRQRGRIIRNNSFVYVISKIHCTKPQFTVWADCSVRKEIGHPLEMITLLQMLSCVCVCVCMSECNCVSYRKLSTLIIPVCVNKFIFSPYLAQNLLGNEVGTKNHCWENEYVSHQLSAWHPPNV